MMGFLLTSTIILNKSTQRSQMDIVLTVRAVKKISSSLLLVTSLVAFWAPLRMAHLALN